MANSGQASLGWTAPHAGTFRSSAVDRWGQQSSMGLALLHDDCRGRELACMRGSDERVEVMRELQQGDRVVVVVVREQMDYEDAEVSVRVEQL